ncbi:MAG: prepilin-type N-terminal cleavage/methylation domain-containing protein, partial [Planctomycetota bacterium]
MSANHIGRLRRGMTLVELLAVLALMGLLMGTGLGLLVGLAPAENAVRGYLEETVRLVAQSARQSGSRAILRWRAGSGELQLEQMRVVGTWAFEGTGMDGALGLNAVWMGAGEARVVPGGFQGSALDLAASPGTWQVPLQDEPAFDWSQGFLVRCAVRPEQARSGVLLQLGEGLVLALSERGAVAAEFRTARVADTGALDAGDRVRVESEAGAVGAGRWSLIEMLYDRRALRLSVDGVPQAVRPEEAPVWMGPPRLQLSDAQHPFPGLVDQLVVSVVEPLPTRVLPAQAVWTGKGEHSLVFGPDGSLDPLYHGSAVTLTWQVPD